MACARFFLRFSSAIHKHTHSVFRLCCWHGGKCGVPPTAAECIVVGSMFTFVAYGRLARLVLILQIYKMCTPAPRRAHLPLCTTPLYTNHSIYDDVREGAAFWCCAMFVYVRLVTVMCMFSLSLSLSRSLSLFICAIYLPSCQSQQHETIIDLCCCAASAIWLFEAKPYSMYTVDFLVNSCGSTIQMWFREIIVFFVYILCLVRILLNELLCRNKKWEFLV